MPEIKKVRYRALSRPVAERGESHIEDEILIFGSQRVGTQVPSSVYLLGAVKARRVPVLKVRRKSLEKFVTVEV